MRGWLAFSSAENPSLLTFHPLPLCRASVASRGLGLALSQILHPSLVATHPQVALAEPVLPITSPLVLGRG